MIHTYPELTQDQVDFAGQTIMCCDAEGCDARTPVATKTYTGDSPEDTIVRGTMPDGWVTSNPLNDPLQGAATFCPDHTDLQPEQAPGVAVDAAEEHPDVLRDEGTSSAAIDQDKPKK